MLLTRNLRSQGNQKQAEIVVYFTLMICLNMVLWSGFLENPLFSLLKQEVDIYQQRKFENQRGYSGKRGQVGQ